MSEKNEAHILEFFDLGDLTQFKQLNLEKIKEIEENSHSISPIIFEIFEKLMKQCLKGYNFTDDEISFTDYMEFYQEVNRIIPRLKKKIITEDCNSSVFYVGDTHGAIQESFKIVDFFYKLFQINKEIKIIFVGDYVDRNPYDLENLTLITAFHLLFPKNVVLIRGNHEDRLINTHYGFFDNLLRTFREKGEELYEEVIKFFTHLPLVHIAQMHSGEKLARVMAVHGGIPIDPLNFLEPAILEEIEPNLKCEVDKSDDMDPYSVSMLWSDPDEMIQGILTGAHLHGRMRFGFPVFKSFIDANKINLVVRGHQKWNNGHHIFFGGQLYSLFSTQTYDGKIKFEPKILKLDFGQTPKVIPIEFESLERELETNTN